MSPESVPTPDARVVSKVEKYRRRKETSVLCIVFADIANSTDLLEGIGEIRYDELRQLHNRSVESQFAADDAGSVVQVYGDGVLAVFSEPSTCVVRCLELQRTMEQHPHFRLRIGVDLGQVAQTKKDGVVVEIFSRHVNRAARIQALGRPGQVIASFPVYDCAVGWLRDEVKWEHLGPKSLKGFAEPVSVHEPRIMERTIGSSRGSETPSAVHLLAGLPSGRRKRAELLTRRPEVSNPPALLWALRSAVDSNRIDAFRPWRRRVLWIDDRPEKTMWLFDLLSSVTRLRLEPIRSTEEARERLLKGRYRLVISDMARGGDRAAGLTFLQWLRSENIAVPVLVFTSAAEAAEYGDRARELGASACCAGSISLIKAIFDLFRDS